MDLAPQIVEGLSRPQKSLPAVLFYDEAGSALFDEITRTEEYYLTRVEHTILERNARDILYCANGHGPLSIVELGAGSAEKTPVLLRCLLAKQGKATYVPIDVSAAAVLAAAKRLERELPRLVVRPLVGDNEACLDTLPANGAARLFIFLGSSIGNHEPDSAAALLARLAASMRPQDRLLLGTDLAKGKAALDAAYNDAKGTTARFNLNVLSRLNREYGADFDLDAFAHHAFYDEEKRRVEMHLVSQRDQRVMLRKLDLQLTLATGESIHTENSYKYTQADVHALADASGLALERTWADDEGRFALHLLRGEAA